MFCALERLQVLKDMHQQEANRLEALQASGDKTVLNDVESHLVWLEKQIDQLEHRIDDHIDRRPDLKRDADLMRTTPSLGDTTVAKVLAYADNLRRFSNGKALAAFIGISPKQR